MNYKETYNGNSPSYRTIADIAKTDFDTPMSDQTAMECIKAMPHLVWRGKGGLEVVGSSWSLTGSGLQIVVE